MEQLTGQRYAELNSKFGNPFIYSLTRRGLFSEVNNLLNAIAYGLITRRRLFIDESTFGGLRWTDVFNTSLPTSEDFPHVSARWRMSSTLDPAFHTISNFIHQM